MHNFVTALVSPTKRKKESKQKQKKKKQQQQKQRNTTHTKEGLKTYGAFDLTFERYMGTIKQKQQ